MNTVKVRHVFGITTENKELEVRRGKSTV